MKTLFRWLFGIAIVLAGVMYFQFGTLSPCGVLRYKIVTNARNEMLKVFAADHLNKPEVYANMFMYSMEHLNHQADAAIIGLNPAQCTDRVLGLWLQQ